MLTKIKRLLLFLGDFLFLILALVLTLVIRYPQNEFNLRWSTHWPHFLVIAGIWLLLFYINDLYNLNLKASGRKFFRLTINTAALASLFSILYFYINVQSNITPRTNLAIFIGLFVVLFFLWRGFYQALVYSVIPKNNLAIIGSERQSAQLITELKNNPGAGYHTALIFKNADEIADLAASIKEKNIRAIVVCDYFGEDVKIREALFECLAYKVTFFNYPDFYELLTGKIPVEAIGPNWFLENLKEGQKNYFHFIKRFWDLSLALLIFLLSLPFWPLVALLIRLSGRGPIFFTQVRYGKNEKSFKIIKFRTMRTKNNDLAPTAENDERITFFGSFLRKTRLDEIPQVLNILKGEMSFIGPRPERPEIAGELEQQIPFYKTRLLIKPGLTGWDQISGIYHSSSLTDSLEKLQYDLYYLKHRSLYLDLSIALKTLATMVSRAGR
jgi:exopolysaccharide biosynthesis polyprenyl glycosylphosphotransferase